MASTPSKRSRALASLDDYTRAPKRAAVEEALLYDDIDTNTLRYLLANHGVPGANRLSKAAVTKSIRRLLDEKKIDLKTLREVCGAPPTSLRHTEAAEASASEIELRDADQHTIQSHLRKPHKATRQSVQKETSPGRSRDVNVDGTSSEMDQSIGETEGHRQGSNGMASPGMLKRIGGVVRSWIGGRE